LNQILKRQTSRFHYGSKVPAVTITNEIRNEKYFNENNAYHATYMIISMNYQKIIETFSCKWSSASSSRRSV
jgi:hypothetical protein